MFWQSKKKKQEEQKKIKLVKFYLDVASKFASRSKDPKTKVGCLIVTTEGIIFPGYNGDEIGGSNERDSYENNSSGFVHAEANALIKFDASLHKNSKMFLTHNPCPICAKMIVNTQAISEVYYAKEYRLKEGINILERSGIRCEKMDV